MVHAKGANVASKFRTRATEAGSVVSNPMAAAEVRSGRRIASSKGPVAAQERLQAQLH